MAKRRMSVVKRVQAMGHRRDLSERHLAGKHGPFRKLAAARLKTKHREKMLWAGRR